jgi:hypothetical protein
VGGGTRPELSTAKEKCSLHSGLDSSIKAQVVCRVPNCE